jgi:hypothetical protein
VLVCERWKNFSFFLLGIRPWKTQKIQLSTLIHDSTIVRVYFEIGSKDEKKDWCQQNKNKQKKQNESIWGVETLILIF